MTTVSASAWSKPGAWALDSEENEAMERLQQEQREKEREISHLPYDSNQKPQPLADFPSLSAAAASKSKKKKGQSLSLSEFQSGKSVSYNATGKGIQAKGLTVDELSILPTGPRERTAEELDRSPSRLGGGFGSYGNGRSRFSNGDDSSNPRWGSSRVSDEPRRNGGFNRESNRESGPSRADEIDDWGAAKKSVAAPAFERRERGGFFDSQSKADESDKWGSNKSFVPSEGRKFGGGFENHRERRGGFETFQKEISNGGGADSDLWGKKREEGNVSGRPRLVLQRRTLPVINGEQVQTGSGPMPRSKGSNPFGEARPREDVLAEKGHDWKKIDEDLESLKIKEKGSSGAVPSDAQNVWKKNSGAGDGRGSSPEDNKTERNWRKTDPVDVPSPSMENTEDSIVEN